MNTCRFSVTLKAVYLLDNLHDYLYYIDVIIVFLIFKRG